MVRSTQQDMNVNVLRLLKRATIERDKNKIVAHVCDCSDYEGGKRKRIAIVETSSLFSS